MSYMSDWLDWKAGKLSDGEIIARCHVDPFFKRWFEAKRSALVEARQGGAGAPAAPDLARRSA
jgi:hypothetical protein